MIYKIDIESIKKLNEISILLENLEIKGSKNVNLMYTAMIKLGQALQEIEALNKDNIVVDKTKGG